MSGLGTPDSDATTVINEQYTSINVQNQKQHSDKQDGKSGLDIYRQRMESDQKALSAQGLQPTANLSLAWKDLSVRGKGGKDEVVYAMTIGSILQGPVGVMRAKKRAAALAAAKAGGVTDKDANLKKGERYLLHQFSGVLKSGQMMLVLGRPQAGTTTFLKTMAGLTQGYSGVDGNVQYGNLASRKQLAEIQGQVVFNADDESHFPNLEVGRTLDFALANSTPSRSARPLQLSTNEPLAASETDQLTKDSLLDIFGLKHTHNTKVGDAYVRGVSGGERKRVSLAEVLARSSAIQLWDKPTRGLDASTALEYTKIMRTLADVESKAIAVSLYQAGNAVYDLFDKVTVIAEGQCIYFGYRSGAQAYFEDLGFEIVEGANVADFLTGVTALSERKIRKDYQGTVPTTVEDFVRCYRQSEVCQSMSAELEQHLQDTASLEREVTETRAFVQQQKHKRTSKNQPQTVSLIRQIKAALIRERQQRWGDQVSFWARQGSTVVMSFVTGSLFYAIPKVTGGLFLTQGAVFLTIIYPALLSMAETTAAFEGRPILAKHKALTMYRPAALVIAQTIADLPMYFLPLAAYAIVIYFLVGFKHDAGSFFIYFLFLYITTGSMSAFFRMIGAAFPTFEDASKVSGFFFNLFATYCGYFIPVRDMKPWFAWTRWINPLYYSWTAIAASEISGQLYQCSPPQLVPYGPGYENGVSQGCSILGASLGTTSVSGDVYLEVAYAASHSYIWRNFGAMMGLWVVFIALNIWAAESTPVAGSAKAYLLFKQGGGDKHIKQAAARGRSARDEEEGKAPTQILESEKTSKTHQKQERSEESSGTDLPQTSNSIFTWKNLDYTVRSEGKDLKLLDNIQGWCKPGQLTALMGSSGAGKTTLLDVLAQRKDTGEVTGEVLVNGQALPIAFQRTTGYCEQLDVHLPQTTVREALEFSALLRQPRSIPDKEKLAYVDTIIDLLQLHDIEDAMVGIPGAGLGVEQRKRLTIGVELVSKPRLLFADEPTSGLDGQSAFQIVQFLRKLASTGQSILVTIHQPSASLFREFDSLLLLKKGGKTVYFGDIEAMPMYFAENGKEFPRGVNPAEYMIDIVSGTGSGERDWSQVWLESAQHREVTEELERLKGENRHLKLDSKDDTYEFASTNAKQLRLIGKRATLQMWRNTDYIINKVALHIGTGLTNGFSFWMLGNSYNDLQRRLFTIFGFIFVAPGVIAQLQPKFIANRDIYETREKKAKMYTWVAFITSEIVAEIPYLFVCGTIYFFCWWPVAGFSLAPSVAGPVILQIYVYEMLYTGIGQFIAAYAPSATFAALINPIMIATLVLFNGAFIPYAQMQEFWKYWLYYLNPFTYLMGGLLVFPLWNQEVRCTAEELGRFIPPAGQTCGAYMTDFLSRTTGYLTNPAATDVCEYCIYDRGSQYLAALNRPRYVYGWRDICITFLFVLSSYGLVYIMMKLRTKQTKKAKA